VATRSADGFQGFPAAATAFFAGLADDNSRAYVTEHRDVLDGAVRQPMAALLAAMPDHLQPWHVFRMNRDVRFSADKSPYKAQHGAVHEGPRGAIAYVHLDATGLLVATGAYVMSRDQLARYRAALDDDAVATALGDALDAVEAAGLEVGPGGAEPLRTAPRGVDRDHPHVELMRLKGLVASARITDPGRLASPGLRDEVLAAFEGGAPLNAWLDRHVGPAEEREGPRPRP
jgi:uncharacterized protein (TIGR02453 family)